MYYFVTLFVHISSLISRMTHSLNFEEDEVSKAKDANMKGDDWYDIYDPRNAITKERNKQAQKEAKQKRYTLFIHVHLKISIIFTIFRNH